MVAVRDAHVAVLKDQVGHRDQAPRVGRLGQQLGDLERLIPVPGPVGQRGAHLLEQRLVVVPGERRDLERDAVDLLAPPEPVQDAGPPLAFVNVLRLEHGREIGEQTRVDVVRRQEALHEDDVGDRPTRELDLEAVEVVAADRLELDLNARIALLEHRQGRGDRLAAAALNPVAREAHLHRGLAGRRRRDRRGHRGGRRRRGRRHRRVGRLGRFGRLRWRARGRRRTAACHGHGA